MFDSNDKQTRSKKRFLNGKAHCCERVFNICDYFSPQITFHNYFNRSIMKRMNDTLNKSYEIFGSYLRRNYCLIIMLKFIKLIQLWSTIMWIHFTLQPLEISLLKNRNGRNKRIDIWIIEINKFDSNQFSTLLNNV